jgi:hypothetical protein
MQPPWPDAIRGHWRGIIEVANIIDDIYILYFWKESRCLIVDAHTPSAYYIDNDWHSDVVVNCIFTIKTPYTVGHELCDGKWYLDGVRVYDSVYRHGKFVVIHDIYCEWIVFRPVLTL